MGELLLRVAILRGSFPNSGNGISQTPIYTNTVISGDY